jgi:hypothetical protein
VRNPAVGYCQVRPYVPQRQAGRQSAVTEADRQTDER